MRIGILRTDNVLPQFQARHGDYPDMFEALLRQVDPSLEFDVVDVREGVPDDTGCDAYVITGSRHSVYDDLPWIPPLVSFLQRALDAGRCVLGICFGHQLMAHFFGGRVGPADVGWGVGVHNPRVMGHYDWMTSQADCMPLLSSHKDQVLAAPPQARIFLASEFCPIAGFTLGDQVITVQGHPEFSAAYAQALMNYRRELLGEETYQQGIASLSLHTEGVEMARWLLAFVHHHLAQNPEAAP